MLEKVEQEILADFISETKELLDSIDEILKGLEKDPANLALIENVCTPIRSINGSCIFFGLRRLNNFSYKIEVLLEKICFRNVAMDEKVVSLLFEGVDILKSMVASVARGGQAKELTKEENSYIKRLESAIK